MSNRCIEASFRTARVQELKHGMQQLQLEHATAAARARVQELKHGMQQLHLKLNSRNER